MIALLDYGAGNVGSVFKAVRYLGYEAQGVDCPEGLATAQKIIGLQEVATLARAEAIEALAARTRRYAAYQRKWLRRLEGLVIVAADRPPEETAAEIVALARTRERLPRSKRTPQGQTRGGPSIGAVGRLLPGIRVGRPSQRPLARALRAIQPPRGGSDVQGVCPGVAVRLFA